ncbi:TPA: hypothetical protein HA244_02385 [Candidatus Micrarchaeota archaeon]|nr:hypothetical protein [Candidatus Micrarchaeota archaeon]
MTEKGEFIGKKCPICTKGFLAKADDIVSEVEGLIFVEKGTRCTHCGEEFIGEAEGQKTIEIARKLGIWGEPLKLYRKLSRSARGTVLRIPIDLEKALGLKGNEEIAISKVGRKILIDLDPS